MLFKNKELVDKFKFEERKQLQLQEVQDKQAKVSGMSCTLLLYTNIIHY